MALTLEEVRKIAALARLRLSSDEEERFVAQLGKVVDYIGQLRNYALAGRIDAAANAESVAPRGAAPGEVRDQPGKCLDPQDFLANAPETMGPYLVVPQVKRAGDA